MTRNEQERDSMKSKLALNIEQRKRDLGIATNLQLSQLSGVSRAVITNVQLQPHKSIMLESGLMLAKALDCRMEWLATGEGPVNLDDVERHQRIAFGCPVLTLGDIAKSPIGSLIEQSVEDVSRERIPCPMGSNEHRFVIRINDAIGKYWAGGLMYFEINSTPTNGKPVLVSMGDGIEIMEYARAHGRVFFKSLSEDIPQELKFIEKTDEMTVLASYVAYAAS